MNSFKLGGLALAVSLALGSGAMAQSMSTDDARRAQDRIEADYAAAVKRCDEESGAAKSECLNTAQREQNTARRDSDTQMGGADRNAMSSERSDEAATGEGARMGDAQRSSATSGRTTSTSAGSNSADPANLDVHTLLFDFGSAEIRPAGRAALDSFIAESRRSDDDRIEVTGHTDRIGSDAVNQALSEQRAEAVRAYLRSEGIESSRVNTSGKGSAQPETAGGDCEGDRSSAVIDCLQPDRRVTLAAAGSRNNR